jgi:tripeptidyl-peptidase-1
MDQLNDFVNDVSTPGSAHYGEHLTRQELADYVRNKESVEYLKRYFEHNNFQITIESRFDDFMYVTGSIQQWERLLSARFYLIQVLDSSSPPLHRSTEYSIPDELTDHISSIFRVTQVPPRNNLVTYSSYAEDLSHAAKSASGIYYGYVSPALLYQYCKLLFRHD